MSDKLRLKEKIGYGFGDFASSMFWKIFAMYLTFYYTDVVELSPESVAMMFIMVRLWDGLNDPLMGIISDRTNSKYGKFRPYLLWIAIPFAIIGIMTFSVPDIGTPGKLIYAYVTYTLMMMIYTAINVPYGSLLAVMTDKPKERTVLASFRYIGAYSGGIFMTASAPYILDFFKNGGNNDAKSYQLMVVIYAIVAALFFLMTFMWTKEKVQSLKEKSSILNDLKDLGKNIQWYIVLGANVLMLVFLTFREASILYYFKYFVQDQHIAFFGEVDWGKLSGAYMTLWLAANMLGAFFAIPLATRMGKKNAFIISMFASAVFSILLYWLNPHDVMLIFLLNVLNGISAGVVLPLVLSMYADIADYSEYKTGRRAVGLLFSSSSMSQKLGLMAGGAIPLYILAAYGFEANAEQTSTSLEGIRLMISIYPGLTAALSGALLFLYKLSDTYMKEILVDLNKRRLTK